MRDLRFAWRQLWKSPGLTAVVALSLGLGIGVNATVLCWVKNTLWRPLPGTVRQDQIVVLVSNQGGGSVSLADLRDFDALRTVFAGAVASQITPASSRIKNRAEWIYGQIATANFFDVLGVRPMLGRTFLPDEDRAPGGNPVVVLSEAFWRRRFGADATVIGQPMDLNRHSFTIIGIVPEEFLGTMTGLRCDFWVPVSMINEVSNQSRGFLTERKSRGLHNLARLQPGVGLEQARAAVATLDAQLAQAYPGTNLEAHHRVLTYAECPYGAQSLLRPVLRLLLVVGAGVWLLVLANVANLLLARAASRQKEIAIRLASGASRARLIRQFLTESLLLALMGGAAGVMMAMFAVDGLRVFLPDLQLPVAVGYKLDAMTLGLTLVLTLASGLMFGLVPALQASHCHLSAVLKEGGRTTAGSLRHHRLRGSLVVVEIALALMLLVGAGLCLRGLDSARQTDFGLNPERVLIAGLQVGMNGYTTETALAFYRRLHRHLAELTGVEEAALASWFPLGLAGCKGHGVDVPGYARPPGEDETYEYAIISPRYFATLEIPLVAGRDFTERDDADVERVAIINEAMAQRFWPGQDPLGRQFRCAGEDRTVVGVTRTGKYNRLTEASRCFFYLPYLQGVPDLDLGICIKTRGHPASFVDLLRQTVHGLDPAVELWGTMPMTQHVGLVLFPQRIASGLLSGLGGAALLLAAMGVYAVMAYAVSQRTQEFGIRLALGARPRDVMFGVLRQGLILTGCGIGAGLALAMAGSRLLSSFLFGVNPMDWATFLVAPLVLAGVALLAIWVPARRATQVDPIVALRCE